MKVFVRLLFLCGLLLLALASISETAPIEVNYQGSPSDNAGFAKLESNSDLKR